MSLFKLVNSSITFPSSSFSLSIDSTCFAKSSCFSLLSSFSFPIESLSSLNLESLASNFNISKSKLSIFCFSVAYTISSSCTLVCSFSNLPKISDIEDS